MALEVKPSSHWVAKSPFSGPLYAGFKAPILQSLNERYKRSKNPVCFITACLFTVHHTISCPAPPALPAGSFLKLPDRIICLAVIIKKPPHLPDQTKEIIKDILLNPGKMNKPIQNEHVRIGQNMRHVAILQVGSHTRYNVLIIISLDLPLDLLKITE